MSHVAVAWPRPRADRWRKGREAPGQYPDLSDSLLHLEAEGFQVAIEDSLGLPLNPLARMHEFYSGLDPLRAARVFRRAGRYDALISVGCSSAYCLVRLRGTLGLRVPIIVIDPALSRGYARRERLQDYVLPRVDKVIVFGKAQLDYLREKYGGRVDAQFVHHRADVHFYDPEATGRETEETGRTVLSVGSDRSRDFDTLIDAMRLVDAAGDFGARCIIHSTLPVKPPGPDVTLQRDTISYVELRQLYRDASVFALPLKDSIHAGGINSLLEAMAMARPVVVTRSQGILDYVVEGQTAMVVEPGDTSGMARAIRRLLEDPDARRRLGEGARRFVVEHCRNALYARSLAAILRDVIRRCG